MRFESIGITFKLIDYQMKRQNPLSIAAPKNVQSPYRGRCLFDNFIFDINVRLLIHYAILFHSEKPLEEEMQFPWLVHIHFSEGKCMPTTTLTGSCLYLKTKIRYHGYQGYGWEPGPKEAKEGL